MAPGQLRRLANESGAVAVEFAMVLPVISLLLFGVIQLSLTLNNYIQLANASAAGARAISTNRGTTTPYTSTISAIDDAASNLSATTLNSATTVTVNGTICSTDAKCKAAYPSTAGTAPSIVTITYPCNLTFLKISIPSCTLSSTATEIIQ